MYKAFSIVPHFSRVTMSPHHVLHGYAWLFLNDIFSLFFCYPLCSCCLFIIIIVTHKPNRKGCNFFSQSQIEGSTAAGLFLFLKLFPWFLHPQCILLYMHVGIMAIVVVRMLWKAYFLSYIPKYSFICHMIDLIQMVGESQILNFYGESGKWIQRNFIVWRTMVSALMVVNMVAIALVNDARPNDAHSYSIKNSLYEAHYWFYYSPTPWKY